LGAIDTEKVALERYQLLAHKMVADILGITPASVRRVIGDAPTCNTARMVKAFAAKLQVDDVLTVNWVDVKDGNYRKALNDLVIWNIQIHDDPAVSPIARKRQRNEELLKVFLRSRAKRAQLLSAYMRENNIKPQRGVDMLELVLEHARGLKKTIQDMEPFMPVGW
jgi:hypothetical protein